jgi:hypothetical protein
MEMLTVGTDTGRLAIFVGTACSDGLKRASHQLCDYPASAVE